MYWLLSSIVLILTASAPVSCQKDGRSLTFRQKSEDLNIEHIISLWNRSVTEEPVTEEPVTEYEWSSPQKVTPQAVTTSNYKISSQVLKNRLPDNFPTRFTLCLRKNRYDGNEYPDQKMVIKCLKVELINKLHDLLASSNKNIKLFNGYLEFQKIENKFEEMKQKEIINEFTEKSPPTKKKYSSKVSFKKQMEEKNEPFVEVPLKQPKASQSHANDYYENYKKMLRELVARKNGAELSRKKREEASQNGHTLEKSARLLENGRKLLSEITNNLENDEEHVESLTQTILDPELVSSINNFTKTYSLRLNFYPGIAARMTRNENSGVTFDLELDDVNEAEEVENEHGDDGGRGGKKKKGNKKISKKTLKKLFPYLLIPFMIQAALLPIVLKFLLFIAIKALIAGKLALILVAFNVIRNASLKTDEDEYIERMSYEHYGYGGGEEYGAWINRRQFTVPDESGEARGATNADVVEPYAAYRPDKEKA